MTTNWIEELHKEEYWVMIGENTETGRPIFERVNRKLEDFITTLLEKQREEDIKILCKEQVNFEYMNEEEVLTLIKFHDKTS